MSTGAHKRSPPGTTAEVDTMMSAAPKQAWDGAIDEVGVEVRPDHPGHHRRAAYEGRSSAKAARTAPLSPPSFEPQVTDEGPKFPKFTKLIRRNNVFARSDSIINPPLHSDMSISSSMRGDSRSDRRSLTSYFILIILMMIILFIWLIGLSSKEDDSASQKFDIVASEADRLAGARSRTGETDAERDDPEPNRAAIAPPPATSSREATDGDAPPAGAPLEPPYVLAGESKRPAADAPYEHPPSKGGIPRVKLTEASDDGSSDRRVSISTGTVDAYHAPPADTALLGDDDGGVEASMSSPEAEVVVDDSEVVQQVALEQPSAVNEEYRIQLGSFGAQLGAVRAWEIFKRDLRPRLDSVEPHWELAEMNGDTRYRLQVGSFASADEARSLCTEIKDSGFDCFVVRGVGSDQR